MAWGRSGVVVDRKYQERMHTTMCSLGDVQDKTSRRIPADCLACAYLSTSD
jgi:hypothetical protein